MTMITEGRVNVADLSARHLTDDPVPHDWEEGFGVDWDCYEPITCNVCGALADDAQECANQDCERFGEDVTDEHYMNGPMIHYYYPVEVDDPAQAARRLHGLNLCVVEVNGQTGIALTGGGMDLTWEIAAGYVRLGYLPPLGFCRLPAMAQAMTEEDRTVVEACRRSVSAMRRDLDAIGRDITYAATYREEYTARERTARVQR